MKILKTDHLAIALKSIESGKHFWSDILGMKFVKTETLELLVGNIRYAGGDLPEGLK